MFIYPEHNKQGNWQKRSQTSTKAVYTGDLIQISDMYYI